MTADVKRVVMISNRLPFVLERVGDEWKVREGSGGLVTALAPVLKNRGGMWIGWPGAQGGEGIDEIVEEASRGAGYTMKGVRLTDEEIDGFYVGMSNEVIWPLFHDLQSMCNFEPAYWKTYRAVNAKFAAAIAEHTEMDDFIWVHDYHLFCVAEELRRRDIRSSIGFFLHIPFPPLDIFLKLPWRTELLRAVLDYDLIGLQTLRDRRNFINCVRSLVDGVRVKGTGPVQELRVGKRRILIGVFPIAIDYRAFEGIADSRTVADEAWYIHEHIPNGKIILGIDRLDYTKGISLRLRAYDRFLADHPELHGQTTLVQVVVPSRRQIPQYRDLKIEIERLVGDINGRYTRSGWVPIHYIHRSLEKTELFAYYRTAEI
ncbi:MAG TPA: trehalose-6-phosphate synthase, partial [Alphaproteobacteria bacterium]|nr:trehalose-6-phosphate synthase [Alphaproteobacteria bacterium]